MRQLPPKPHLSPTPGPTPGVLLGTPKVHFKRGYKYQLVQDYVCYIGIDCSNIHTPYVRIIDGVLYIQAGYAWDGASGPTWDTMSTIRASLEHDALYQLMRHEYLPRHYQAFADHRLKTVGIEDGMWPLRAGLWEAGLGIFGSANTDPDNKRPILVAP